MGAKYCNLHVCVCLSARTSQKPHVQTSRDFLYSTRYLWSWLGPPVTTVQHVMYFRFLWMTSYLCIMAQMQTQTTGELFTVFRQVAPRMKSAVDNCLVASCCYQCIDVVHGSLHLSSLTCRVFTHLYSARTGQSSTHGRCLRRCLTC